MQTCPTCGVKVKKVKTDKGSEIILNHDRTTYWKTDSRGLFYTIETGYLLHAKSCRKKQGRGFRKNVSNQHCR